MSNKMFVYTVRDNKVEAFLQPFFMPNVATAIRGITNCVMDVGHAFNQNPEDYALYEVGEYDPETGQIDGIPPVHIINLIDLVKAQADNFIKGDE